MIPFRFGLVQDFGSGFSAEVELEMPYIQDDPFQIPHTVFAQIPHTVFAQIPHTVLYRTPCSVSNLVSRVYALTLCLGCML